MTYNNLTHAYYVSQEKKTNKFPSNYLYQPIAYSYHFNESMKSIQMIIPRVTVAPDLKKKPSTTVHVIMRTRGPQNNESFQSLKRSSTRPLKIFPSQQSTLTISPVQLSRQVYPSNNGYVHREHMIVVSPAKSRPTFLSIERRTNSNSGTVNRSFYPVSRNKWPPRQS